MKMHMLMGLLLWHQIKHWQSSSFQVLCELEIAMMEKGITVKREDPGQGPITRSIMSDAIRDIEDESYRNLRDWYIYR